MSRPDIPLTWLFALSFLLGALAVVGRSSAEGEPPADAVVELFGEELRADSGSAVGIADLDRDGVDELVIGFVELVIEGIISELGFIVFEIDLMRGEMDCLCSTLFSLFVVGRRVRSIFDSCPVISRRV